MKYLRHALYIFILLFGIHTMPGTRQIDYERLWLLESTLEYQIKILKERLLECPEADNLLTNFKGYDRLLLYSQLELIDINVLNSVQTVINFKEQIYELLNSDIK